jgi:hypothetical protein
MRKLSLFADGKTESRRGRRDQACKPNARRTPVSLARARARINTVCAASAGVIWHGNCNRSSRAANKPPSFIHEVRREGMKKFVAIVGGLTLASGMALAGGDMEGQAKSFNELDENQDGVITQTEASADQNLVAEFQTADANQDGYLTPAEYDTIQQETEEAE